LALRIDRRVMRAVVLQERIEVGGQIWLGGRASDVAACARGVIGAAIRCEGCGRCAGPMYLLLDYATTARCEGHVGGVPIAVENVAGADVSDRGMFTGSAAVVSRRKAGGGFDTMVAFAGHLRRHLRQSRR